MAKGMKIRSAMAAKMRIRFKRGGKLQGMGKNTRRVRVTRNN